VVVFTGAGVSAESGVPTFRGPGGLWKTFRPEQLATPEAFARDPRLVWEWYGWRRELLAACRPNLAHVAIGRWMLLREGVTLVTQNVDDLHERGAGEAALGLAREGRPPRAAGIAPIRLHGSIFHVRCTRCGARHHHRDRIDAASAATLPRCAGCGGLLRPDVVWFGEALPEGALEAAFGAAAAAAVCLVVGTAGAVHPAAALVDETAGAGGRVIVVDPGETAYDGMADVRLWGAAGEVVPELLGGG
jgi:NAD-dependent deacetylase